MLQFRFKRGVVWITAASASVVFASSRACAGTPLYSMETLYNATGVPDAAGTRPDDFHPNGGGTTVSQDTIGTTDGAHSMKFTMVQPATFSGAETELLPAHLNDDNSAITFDVTIPSTGQFSGNFANIGIKEFGTNPTFGSGDCEVIAEGQASVNLSPGTHHLGVPLIARSNPFTFDSNVSFASCFGPDPNTQMTPADWEFFINKSTENALTVYVDNIQIVPFFVGDANYDGRINALDFNALATNYGTTNPLYERGDFNFDGHIDSGDFTLLASHFNQTAAGPALGSVVPEPATLASGAAWTGILLVGARRRRAATKKPR